MTKDELKNKKLLISRFLRIDGLVPPPGKGSISRNTGTQGNRETGEHENRQETKETDENMRDHGVPKRVRKIKKRVTKF